MCPTRWPDSERIDTKNPECVSALESEHDEGQETRVTASRGWADGDPDGQAPADRSASDLLEGLPQVAAVLGTLGGLLGLIYGIGGAVMWLRFNKGGFPADQAVALMPKADLLVVGLRVMVVPALGAAIVLVGLASIRVGRQRRFERLSDQLTDLRENRSEDDAGPEAPDDAAHAAKVAEIEDELARLRDRPRPLQSLPVWARAPARLVLFALVAVLVVIVPFSPAAFAWPVVLVGLVAYWLRLRRSAPLGGNARFPLARIAIAGILGAAIISVARQTDPPARLPSVQVFATQVPGLAQALGLPATEPGTPIQLNGSLITSGGDTVSVGDPTNGKIITVPRSRVTSLTIGAPLDLRAPPRSLMSMILGGDRAWALTPLEIWCVHLRYGWSWQNIVHFCGGRPKVEADYLRLDRRGSMRSDGPRGDEPGIVVVCPASAPDVTCVGFLSVQFPPLRTPAGSVLVGETPAAAFQIARGHHATIALKLEPQDAERLCGNGELNVRVLLTLDATREAKLRDTPLRLRRPSQRKHGRRCVVAAARGGKGSGGGSQGGGSQGGGSQGGGSQGGGSQGGGSQGGGSQGGGSSQGGSQGGGTSQGGGDDQGAGTETPTPTPVSSGPTPAPFETAQPIRTATPTPP
jgi:hypothetical protein